MTIFGDIREHIIYNLLSELGEIMERVRGALQTMGFAYLSYPVNDRRVSARERAPATTDVRLPRLTTDVLQLRRPPVYCTVLHTRPAPPMPADKCRLTYSTCTR